MVLPFHSHTITKKQLTNDNLMKMIIKMFSLLMISSTVAYGADWHLLETHRTNEELYIDRDSIAQIRNSAVRVAYKFNTVGDAEEFIRITSIMRCKDKSQTIEAIRLVSLMRDQNFIYDEDKQRTSPIKFETRNGDVFNYVCKPRIK